MEITQSKINIQEISKKFHVKIYPFSVSDNEYPVAGEKISAGFPAFAENFKTDPISIDKVLVKKPESTFIIQVQGDSMVDVGIFNNSYIVVDTSIKPENNNIIVARYFDEFLVKRIFIYKDYAVLHAENSNNNYADIKIDEDTEFEIWGVVTGTFKTI